MSEYQRCTGSIESPGIHGDWRCGHVAKQDGLCPRHHPDAPKWRKEREELKAKRDAEFWASESGQELKRKWEEKDRKRDEERARYRAYGLVGEYLSKTDPDRYKELLMEAALKQALDT